VRTREIRRGLTVGLIDGREAGQQLLSRKKKSRNTGPYYKKRGVERRGCLETGSWGMDDVE